MRKTEIKSIKAREILDSRGNPTLEVEVQTPGLFAAGDVTAGKYKQIIIAAGQGARAALSAYEYLRKKSL